MKREINSWHMTGFASLSYLECHYRDVLHPKTPAERQAVDSLAWRLAHYLMKRLVSTSRPLRPDDAVAYWRGVECIQLHWIRDNIANLIRGNKQQQHILGMIARHKEAS